MDAHLINDANDVIKNLGSLNLRFSGKKILITGASGFLGSQFIYFFLRLNELSILDEPCHVYGLDNFIRSMPEWLFGLESRSDLDFQKLDVTQKFEFGNPDFIIHAASIASPLFYRKYPIETMDANVQGLRNVLDYSRSNTVESILFFSSSEIYGDPDPRFIPTPEDYWGNVSCNGPRACYDESKRFGETLSVNFWRCYGVPVKIVRPFNNYGPGLNLSDRRVIPDFFRDVILDKPIVLHSDGTATRTFCYVTDAIEGYLRLMLSDINGEPFNIGVQNPEINMRDLANLIIDISEKELSVIYEKNEDPDYLVDNPNRRCPSIKKAKKLLDFNPTVSLEEGLRRSYSFYLDHS